jgi:hypothetical protein
MHRVITYVYRIIIEKNDPNQNAECPLKTNWIKLALGLTVPLEKFLGALTQQTGLQFKISSSVVKRGLLHVDVNIL